MNHIIKFTMALGLLAITMSSLINPPCASAADYGVQQTFWSVTDFTNAPGTATNLASFVDVRQFSEFYLEVKTGLTNASAGTIDLRWATSADGVNYCSTFPCPGNTGWFSTHLTNGATSTTWITNVTVNSAGYWGIIWATNNSAQHMTNITIRAYAKPLKYKVF